MAKDNILEGVFAINKPMGMSSAQVIRDCQHHFQNSATFAPLLEQERESRAKESWAQKKRRGQNKRDIRVKIGHGGTLDPLATGVLILGVGRGTKALQGFLSCTKTYETVVLFGASTDTYDRVGRIIKKGNYSEVTREVVEKALEDFRGKYRQMPPLYSALKMEGKPLYEYAREGKPIPREIETREVDVQDLELVEWYEPGTHNHRWPTEEADLTEKNLVDSVWRVAKRQIGGEDEASKLTPEQEQQETQALADYKTTKRAAEESFDGLVHENDKAQKRQKVDTTTAAAPGEEPLMSGALGSLPQKGAQIKGKGSDLIPPPPGPDTPPPWEGKGPPAVKIRMTVTSGFYVRSFCHDLGEKLGSGAMMAELCRSRQGQYEVRSDSCIEYEDVLAGEEKWAPTIQHMLSSWLQENGPTGAYRPPPAPEPKKTEMKPILESTESVAPVEPSAEVLTEAAKAPDAVAEPAGEPAAKE